MTRIRVTPEEFSDFSKYILDISGIALGPGKEYLLETRLGAMMRQLECQSYRDLLQKVRFDGTGKLKNDVINAISTNETYFFRDQAPFKLLQYKIIPDVIDKRSRRQRGIRPALRIWSAANSTGQEIYSIAMILLEMGITSEKYNIHLFGTDISDTAISQAASGIYNRFEVSRGLDPKWLHKYFLPHNDKYQVKDELKRMVQFKTMNLMNPFSIGKFDIVLCRNVMIYFTAQTRKKIYSQLSSSMEKDGYLIIGSTESLVNDTDLFTSSKYLNSIFYQLK